MELEIQLDEELKGAKLEYKNFLPVFSDFDYSRVLGEAEVILEGDTLKGVVNIVDSENIPIKTLFENYSELLELKPCGRAIKKRGNTILEFSLTGVSIVKKL